MKKIFFAIMLGVFAFVSGNICSAAMPVSEMYLGGLTTRTSTYAEMVRMYGEPTNIDAKKEYDYSGNYGNSVRLIFQGYGYGGQSGGQIIEIRINENNGWKNPAGIGVGSDIARLIDLYGEPDYKESSEIKEVYSYCGDVKRMEVTGTIQPGVEMVFISNKKSGKILEIILTSASWGMNFRVEHPKWLKILAE